MKRHTRRAKRRHSTWAARHVFLEAEMLRGGALEALSPPEKTYIISAQPPALLTTSVAPNGAAHVLGAQLWLSSANSCHTPATLSGASSLSAAAHVSSDASAYATCATSRSASCRVSGHAALAMESAAPVAASACIAAGAAGAAAASAAAAGSDWEVVPSTAGSALSAELLLGSPPASPLPSAVGGGAGLGHVPASRARASAASADKPTATAPPASLPVSPSPLLPLPSASRLPSSSRWPWAPPAPAAPRSAPPAARRRARPLCSSRNHAACAGSSWAESSASTSSSLPGGRPCSPSAAARGRRQTSSGSPTATLLVATRPRPLPGVRRRASEDSGVGLCQGWWDQPTGRLCLRFRQDGCGIRGRASGDWAAHALGQRPRPLCSPGIACTSTGPT